MRFALEFIRADNNSTLYVGMTGLQISLLALSVAMLVMYLRDANKKKQKAAAA